MARATFISMKKVAQGIALQALDLLHLLTPGAIAVIRLARAYLFSAMNLPALRRTSLWRELRWLKQRFMLLMSDGYNFEEFYRTQHGVRRAGESDRAGDLGQMSTRQLLSVAHDLGHARDGVVAMRELIARAEERAALRALAPDTARYKPMSHDSTIHHQWRDAIEMAFAPDRAASHCALPLPERSQVHPKKGTFIEPGWAASQPLLVEDDAAFELSIPEIVSYRASTRH